MTTDTFAALLFLAACTGSPSGSDDTTSAGSEGTELTAGSDTETEAETDPDTVPVGGDFLIKEDYWDVESGCWRTRDVMRPGEYWSAPWSQDYVGDSCYSYYGGPMECYQIEGDTFEFGECQALYEVHAAPDGMCTRYITEASNPPVCPITDPWVGACEDAAGCCDLDRAHRYSICEF